jgi:hypothetical protein
MKLLTRIALIIIALYAPPAGLHAQDYSFSYSTGTYSHLTGAMDLTQGQPWTDLQFEIPLDSGFVFYGTRYDTLHVRGYVHFDNAITKYIDPYFVLFADRGESPVLYKYDTASGEPVVRIEWKNMGFYGEKELLGTQEDSVSVQLWLYLESGNITVLIGPNAVVHTYESFWGKSGPAIGLTDLAHPPPGTLVRSIYLSGDPLAPQLVQNDTTFQTYLTGSPAEGMIYSFEYIPAGIGKHSLPAAVLCPNPVEDDVTLRISQGGPSWSAVTVINQLGYTVEQRPLTRGQTTVEFDASAWIPGLYIIRLSAADAIHCLRLIKK